MIAYDVGVVPAVTDGAKAIAVFAFVMIHKFDPITYLMTFMPCDGALFQIHVSRFSGHFAACDLKQL